MYERIIFFQDIFIYSNFFIKLYIFSNFSFIFDNWGENITIKKNQFWENLAKMVK